MNDCERELIRFVCDGDIRKAQTQARIILKGISTKRDEQFRDNMLRKLDAKGNLIELPNDVRNLLIAEDSADFPEGRYLFRESEEKAVSKIISLYRVADKLEEMGIPYQPALILYGESGCGKTMLARYIAHKVNLPFVYVQFSRLVSSLLGSTQANIGKVFEYARTAPCVLCFDEIDAIGIARGQKDDVGEMNRIVIALMQEFDRISSHSIIIATTNRFDRLDPALVRRFPLQYELTPLSPGEAIELAYKFFRYTGYDYLDFNKRVWCEETFTKNTPASSVVKECTDYIVARIMEEAEEKE